MSSTLRKFQDRIKKQPIKLTGSLEKEYNLLIKGITQKEKEARKQGAFIPAPPGVLNREGGDPTLVNDPLLSAVHFHNYLAAKQIIKSFSKKTQLDKIRVLGVGEGAGVFAYFLASALKPKTYLATDYQNWLVDYGKKVLGGNSLEFQKLDATAMDLIQDNSFDIVVACELIEHLPSNALVAFLKEGRRVLKKNGLLITTTPNRNCHPEEKFSGYLFHFTEFTAKELNAFIEKRLPKVFNQYSIFHLSNEKICRDIQRRFLLSQGINCLYRNLLKLFPRSSRRERALDRVVSTLYGGWAGERRKKLSFPGRYNQTKLVYQPKDETKTLGLCLVLQA